MTDDDDEHEPLTSSSRIQSMPSISVGGMTSWGNSLSGSMNSSRASTFMTSQRSSRRQNYNNNNLTGSPTKFPSLGDQSTVTTPSFRNSVLRSRKDDFDSYDSDFESDNEDACTALDVLTPKNDHSTSLPQIAAMLGQGDEQRRKGKRDASLPPLAKLDGGRERCEVGDATPRLDLQLDQTDMRQKRRKVKRSHTLSNGERPNIYSASKVSDFTQGNDALTTPITTPRSANNIPLTLQLTPTNAKNASGFLVPISENDKIAKSARGAGAPSVKKSLKGRRSQRNFDSNGELQLTTVKGLLHVEGESLPGGQPRVKWEIREEDESVEDDVTLATSALEVDEPMTGHQSRPRDKKGDAKRRVGNTPR